MTTRTATDALRLPASIEAEAERLAAALGTSLNPIVASAVGQVAARRPADILERRAKADRAAFDRLMRRQGG